MQYTIYADSVEEVKKGLSRIAKKAERYGVPFSFSFGEEYPKNVCIHEYDDVNNCLRKTGSFAVSAIDVTVDCDQLIKSGDWTVVAHIEHGDEGNIVTGIGSDIKDEWYRIAPHCDHCRKTRDRKVTFIVQNPDGELKQVGRSCLKEYTGIDPLTAVLWAAVRDLFPDMEHATGFPSGVTYMCDTVSILAYAYDSIKENGYVRSDEMHSTKSRVIEKLSHAEAPSDEGLAEADKIIAWLCDIGDKFDNGDLEVWKYAGDLERNCVPLARSGYVKKHGIGRLCYIPVSFAKFNKKRLESADKQKAKAEAAARSQYVGNIGERIQFIARQIDEVTSFDTMFGTTYLYKMLDGDGNVFVWFASGKYNTGENVLVKGTVKEHSEYDGVKQTVLTRCKYIA